MALPSRMGPMSHRAIVRADGLYGPPVAHGANESSGQCSSGGAFMALPWRMGPMSHRANVRANGLYGPPVAQGAIKS